MPDTGPFARAWPLRAAAAAAALLVVGPGLEPGYVLVRDMVFVPRQYLLPDALGLGGALPRAVPADAATALLTAVVPGQIVQKVVLAGIVAAAVLGAARLAPRRDDGGPGAGSVAAAAVYGWSPFLAERLLMGHWSLLLAWAALPWVLVHATALSAGRSGATARLVVVLAVAALTPTGSLLAGVAAVVLAGRRRPVVAGAAVVLALPWVVAGLLHPGAGTSDPAGVAAFAARPDGPWGGVLVSLLGGGGIWNGAAVPASRASPVTPLVTLVLAGLAVAGWVVALRFRSSRDGADGPVDRADRDDRDAGDPGGARAGRGSGTGRGPGAGVLLLGIVGLALAVAGAVPGASDALAWAVVHVPGAGLLRDGQKWVLWWLPALAVGAGTAVHGIARAGLSGRRGGVAAGTVVALLVVLAVPDLGWGVGGRLRAVDYPPDWERVRAVLAADPAPGDVLVLPPGAIRSFAWNGDRVQLDPAPRYLPRPVVVTDDLVVSGRTIAGEDVRARTVLAASDDPARLAGLGVGWVLVEHGTAGPPLPDWVAQARRTVAGPWLDLVRVPDARPAPAASAGRTAAMVAAHLLALLVLVAALAGSLSSHVSAGIRRRGTRARE